LLNVTAPTTFGWEDGELTQLLNNGTSMRSLRLSRITTGNRTLLTSKEMELLQMLDVQQLTLDGGKFSDMQAISLRTIKVKYLIFKEM
jgi:hypothetical protein